MNDRRSGTWCVIHLVPFMQCPCEDRRAESTGGALLICTECWKHTSECACENPVLEERAAV